MSPQVSSDIVKSMAPVVSYAHKVLDNPKSIQLKLLEIRLNRLVQHDITNKFWAYFPQDFEKYKPDSYQPLIEAVDFLAESCRKAEKSLAGQAWLKQRFPFVLKTQLLSDRPHYLHDYFEATYLRALRAFLRPSNEQVTKDENTMDCDDEADDPGYDYMDFDKHAGINNQLEDWSACPGCSLQADNCKCAHICDKFSKMNAILRDLNLLEHLASDTIMVVSKAIIERRVAAKCKSNYSTSYLDELTGWLNGTIKPWISQIYGASSSGCLDTLGKRLDEYLESAYAESRISLMFELILEYPNSEAAIQDLKLCLERATSSNFRLNLIDSVKQSIAESILHPGVNTSDILTAYISTIKALRALDPSGLILQLVCEPMRHYLKSRSDTVRCIVTALTDEDNNSDLNREMIKSSTQTNENGVDLKAGPIEMNLPTEGEKCTLANYESWKPDPIKLSSLDEVMKTSRFSDIVSMLVNIYETKDLYVEEYQKLLSQRILNKYDECNLDTEFRNLELLTLRFGDCELHRSEVMLKDVQTSRRINKRILSGDIKEHKLTDFRELNVLIVSSPFWPDKFSAIATIDEEPPKVAFPAKIQAAIDTYTKAFETIQASRTLHWRHHLGSVNMDVKINGTTQNFTVTPLHASLLCLFQGKKVWRIHELQRETSLPAATVRSRLAFWQRNGLIRDCGEDKFELIIQ